MVHDYGKFALHLTMSFGEDAMSALDKPNRLVRVNNPNDKNNGHPDSDLSAYVKMLYQIKQYDSLHTSPWIMVGISPHTQVPWNMVTDS